MDKTRILSCKNVRNLIIIICSLFVRVNCAANKSKFDLEQNLLEQKTRSFILSLFPWMLEIWIWFWGSMPIPLENVDHWPLVDTVGYSIQSCWLLQFLLKLLRLWECPSGEFPLYNIMMLKWMYLQIKMLTQHPSALNWQPSPVWCSPVGIHFLIEELHLTQCLQEIHKKLYENF